MKLMVHAGMELGMLHQDARAAIQALSRSVVPGMPPCAANGVFLKMRLYSSGLASFNGS